MIFLTPGKEKLILLMWSFQCHWGYLLQTPCLLIWLSMYRKWSLDRGLGISCMGCNWKSLMVDECRQPFHFFWLSRKTAEINVAYDDSNRSYHQTEKITGICTWWCRCLPSSAFRHLAWKMQTEKSIFKGKLVQITAQCLCSPSPLENWSITKRFFKPLIPSTY